MKRSIAAVFVILLILISVTGLCDRFNPTSVTSGSSLPTGQASSIATSPVSSYRNSLIRSRDYNYGFDGNLTITGNVSGDRYFRGVVPYGSAYELSTTLDDDDSVSVNSFLRRSSGINYSNQSGLSIGSRYFNPSRTVTSIQRGTESGLSFPQISPQATGQSSLQLPTDDIQLLRKTIEQRPLTMTTAQLERLITQERSLLLDELRKRDEILPEEFIETGKIDKNKQLLDELLQKVEPPKPVEPAKPEDPDKIDVKDIEEQKSKLIDLLDPDKAQEDAEENFRREEDSPTMEDLWKPGKYAPEIPAGKEIAKVDPGEAAAIRGPHKTFASLAEARFNEHIENAEKLMEEGEFYRAADAYTLASVWDPLSHLPYAGKAYALFGVGEYMSSSYFLEKAISLSPEFAAEKVDLAGILGDRDLFENRIIEMSEWLEKNRSGELALLMAYVLYNDDKTLQAKDAINLASEKMPDNNAVAVLKKVIENN